MADGWAYNNLTYCLSGEIEFFSAARIIDYVAMDIISLCSRTAQKDQKKW